MKSHESRQCDGFLRSMRCVVERENSLLCTNTGRVFTFFSILLRTDLFRPFSNVYRQQTRNSFFPSQVVSALFRSRGSTFSLLSRATSFPVLLVERDEANRSQLRVNSTLLSRYYPSFGIFAHGCESNYIHRNIHIPSTFLLFLFLFLFFFFSFFRESSLEIADFVPLFSECFLQRFIKRRTRRNHPGSYEFRQRSSKRVDRDSKKERTNGFASFPYTWRI